MIKSNNDTEQNSDNLHMEEEEKLVEKTRGTKKP